jgi:predicted DNA-binding transcriptional regulator AlpA
MDSLNLSTDFEKSRILNSAQSAKFIGLSVPHFRRHYRSGKAPKPLLVGERKYGWRAGDLVQWLATRAGGIVDAP